MDTTIPILIPLYNGIEFLKEALDSVISQTYPHWEVHVGVNGHRDSGGHVGSLASALATMDPRIHVHIQASHIQGKVASLHDLMTKTHPTHEWIALLDADDIWHPTKLEEQVAALQGAARETDVVGTWCRYIGEMSGSPNIPSGPIDPHILVHMNPMINSSVLIRRSWCRWRYVELEDYELWMQVVLGGGHLYNVGKVLVDHRIHRASAFNTKNHDPQVLQERFRGDLFKERS